MESKRTDLQIKSKSVFQLETLIAIGLGLFLLLLPFHLVIKRLIPGPVGTYWKEILLGVLVLLWLLRCLVARRFLFSGTAIDWAVLIYLAFMVLRFILDWSGWVGAWGFYVSVMYLPVFWLVPAALHLHTPEYPRESGELETNHLQSDYEKWVTWLLIVLVVAGTLIAIGGIIEFVLDYPLWPSDEVLQRQGFPDVFIYATQIRRVYFTLDSPTALANTLAMLLPLALVLPFVLKRTWERILAGVAGVLMAACIILTFSRGIWVAVVLAMIVMGITSGLMKKNWRSVLVFVGSLVLIGLVWLVIMFARTDQARAGEQGVVELTSADYLGLPLESIRESLLTEPPEFGQAATQTWPMLDSQSGLEDVREVLYEHPQEGAKTEIIYQVEVPQSGALRFGIGLAPEVWTPDKGDGTSFQIFITAPGQSGKLVFVRYINPKLNPNDRRWRNYYLDLSPWAGQTINLSFVTEPGPKGDWEFDWAGWSDLQVVTLTPGYTFTHQVENAVMRHTRSILDWASDETNRDRLAAWDLAMETWREAPFWGNGLGTTGVAAFRTHPENAFAPESQVLKSLVELGIPGFLVLGFLWFQIAVTGYFAFDQATGSRRLALLLGVLTSLLIVFIDGLVYQNLEVKQVNAYFWTMVGVLAVLASVIKRESSRSPVRSASGEDSSQ